MIIMQKKSTSESTEIAGRVYQPSDYEKKDQMSSGLATTHEQASDTLTEGEIGAVVDDVDGKDIPLNHKEK